SADYRAAALRAMIRCLRPSRRLPIMGRSDVSRGDIAMKRIAFVVFVMLAHNAPVAAQKLTEAEIKEGFVSLFNGKDWSGWQFGGGYGLPDKVPPNWTIKDGVIHLTGGGAP